MANVLLAGESWISTTVEYKGFDSFSNTKLEIGCEKFLESLTDMGHHVTHLLAHDVPERFPWSRDELNEYDVVILSDIGANSLLLPASVFYDGRCVANRLDVLAEWVKEGHGLMMAGGYLSFGGFEGKAHYHGTAVEKALPVDIKPYDDRVEMPQGVCAEILQNHPAIGDLENYMTDRRTPPILGYQQMAPKSNASVLMQVNSDPLLVIGQYGMGRSAAYASDISPHWASEEFMNWNGYSQLFGNLTRWLASENN